ncbi:MAG: Spermidine/putrescine transport ATP-binding protein potA [uncultured bacterium]|nr:MAG: Spermidine/putrescine transport ATP-binding protein potA [uncultured bacterium]HLE76566.1 ABC transporter ATP-binding protein [Candidatus Babeliales bacterium]
MKNIVLKDVSKAYHGELVLENINLTIPGGKFFALLGPSGSGKTTILRLIGGFEKPTEGSLYLGDENITDVPINERRVNTVFQQYALFPHMDVFENVAYSLRIRNVASDSIEQKVHKVLRAVGLEKQIYKDITQLSGGQQQRVALARAIINEPEVLLLDEPLAALDLKLRERMLIELIDLQSTLNTTFVYVTHDQFEALTVADTMAIMNEDGQIEQMGTPKEIYEFPVSSFVAKFVGTTNILEGTIRKGSYGAQVEIPNMGTFEVAVPENKQWIVDGGRVLLSLRPEKIEIRKTLIEGFSNKWLGVVQAIVYHGRSTQYNVRLKNDQIIQVFEQNEEHFEREVIDYDDQVYLYWQKENVVLLDR